MNYSIILTKISFSPETSKSKLYYPLIQSHIDYCITVWGSCAKTSLSLIQNLQNRIARFLTCKYDYIRYLSSDLRKELNWMSVSERYNYFLSILMYNCVKFRNRDCKSHTISLKLEAHLNNIW